MKNQKRAAATKAYWDSLQGPAKEKRLKQVKKAGAARWEGKSQRAKNKIGRALTDARKLKRGEI